MADNPTPPYGIPTASSNYEQYGVAAAEDRSISTDNIFVMNAGLNPMPNFNFMLRVEGAIDVPCRSIKAFTRELEFEIIQEGGLNDYVHMRRKPISKPFYIEVERYVGTDYVDPLPLGAELLLPVILFVSRMAGKFSIVARTYTFTGCTVTKKTYGDLNAEQSGLYVETTTIAYREMVCVDMPSLENNLPNYGDDPKKSLSMERAATEKKAEKERLQRLAEFDKKYSGGHDVDTSHQEMPKPLEETPFDQKYGKGHDVDTSEQEMPEPLEDVKFDRYYADGHHEVVDFEGNYIERHYLGDGKDNPYVIHQNEPESKTEGDEEGRPEGGAKNNADDTQENT